MIDQRREVVRQEVARDLQLALLALADELTGLAERVGSLAFSDLAAVSDFVGDTRPPLPSRSVLQAARGPPATASAPTSAEHVVTVVVATGSRHERSSRDLDPASGRVECVRRGRVERDRCVGGVPTHQIDHPLEQLRLIAHTATNDDALPRLSAKGVGDDGLHVVSARSDSDCDHARDGRRRRDRRILLVDRGGRPRRCRFSLPATFGLLRVTRR
jgi:hypothetical protein